MIGRKQRQLRVWITTVTILVFVLFLAGCGRETAEREEPSGTGESIERTVSAEQTVSTEQTVSADVEEPETADPSEERSGRFQYDESLFALNLPVITEEQALADGKTILTLHTSLPNSWLKDLVAGFNRQSSDYFIRREETYDEDRLLTELMAGRGPDIFAGDLIDVTESILQKGVLVDLAPGLDAMGINDEEYFPSCRALRMEDRVYGIRVLIAPSGISMRKSVLGGEEQPDIETLVEKLYTYPDQDAAWWSGARSEKILEYLLSGSEDLWGMIDWENGTCDFSGELFAKILEIAKRYADPERKTQEMEEKQLVDFYEPIAHTREQLESEGKVIINYLFDDGNYPAFYSAGSTLMLNANSKQQEGAWKFLEYAMGEEGQCYVTVPLSVAASREMSRNYYEYTLRVLEEGRMETNATYTPETIEEYFVFAEQGHEIPLRTKEILAIIYEDAQPFCDGDKSLEEVRDTIQKRVQIYISETM